MDDKTKQNVEDLGLKTDYTFKHTRIPITGDVEDTRQKLIEKVAPVIRELKLKSLINGFYYVIHTDIDLCLSCDNWEVKEKEIQSVLSAHGISDSLALGGNLWPEDYGGEWGAALTENNLELSSRLVLSMLEAKKATDNEDALEILERLCPHQWIHHLCNQYGLNNLQESVFNFNSAFVWLETIMQNHADIPEITSEVQRILDYFRGRLAFFEDTYFGNKKEDA